MILTEYSIKFRVAVMALIAMLIVAGPIVYLTMPREGAPDITIPYVFVSAAYEGVAPQEIENLVTIPLEKKLGGLENVKKMTSTSAEGFTFVMIEFTPKENIDFAIQKVKDKIDLAKPDMPDDLDQPTVQGLNFSTDIPVLRFTLSGDSDIERLRRIAERIQDDIELVPGVLQARIMGVREREIRVELDLQRVIANALSIDEVMGALRSQNSTVSAGNLEMKGDKFQVRIPGEFTSVNEIGDVIVRSDSGGRSIRLRDVADINDTYKDLSSLARVNTEPCVSINIHKRSGENAHEMIKRIKKVMAGISLPHGLKITIVEDQSEMMRLMIEDLENNIISGCIFIVAILLLFLGLRNSIMVGLAVPLSMMLGLVVMQMMGMTLNMIVLFSLVLTVGMLVDNAIVIVENVFRHHVEGESRMDAAMRGASEVAWPVITSTLTTVAVFCPMLFWPDVVGQFMGFLPKTAIIVLLSSLFVALTMNPVLCSLFIQKPAKVDSLDEPGRWRRFTTRYEKVLRAAIAHRWLCILIGLLLFVFSIAAMGRYSKGLEFFPSVAPRAAYVDLKYAEGTDVMTTDGTMRHIESVIRKYLRSGGDEEKNGYRDVEFILANVGSSAGNHMSAGEAAPHLGSIYVEFVDFALREGDTSELLKKMRAEIGSVPGAEIKIEGEKMGPPTGIAVSIEIAGEDFSVLGDLADQVKKAVKGIPGLVDVQDDMEDSRPEIAFTVDKDSAALLGVNSKQVGDFLRTLINGDEAGKFRAGEDEYDITVRLREDQRRSVALLKQVSASAMDGTRVPIMSIGDFTYQGGRGKITRKDQKRVVAVTGNNQDRTVESILTDVKKEVAGVKMPPGYSISYAGDTEERDESAKFLSRAFLIALALIAVIMVMQFNSVMLTFIIMVSIVLSMVGVMWSLLLTGKPCGVIMSGIAVISLAGVVVNNGIVLIDCIRLRKNAGLDPLEAIVSAGRLRLRPVLLTAMTTTAGLVPMAMGWSIDFHTFPPTFAASAETSSWWAPMAVAVICGLSLATVLTLIQVPVMVSIADSFAGWLRRKFSRPE